VTTGGAGFRFYSGFFVKESVLGGDVSFDGCFYGVYFWVFRLYTASFLCILIFTCLGSS